MQFTHVFLCLQCVFSIFSPFPSVCNIFCHANFQILRSSVRQSSLSMLPIHSHRCSMVARFVCSISPVSVQVFHVHSATSDRSFFPLQFQKRKNESVNSINQVYLPCPFRRPTSPNSIPVSAVIVFLIPIPPLPIQCLFLFSLSLSGGRPHFLLSPQSRSRVIK